MKRFLFRKFPSANYFITKGWMASLATKGNQISLWDSDSTPTFDAFDVSNPDVFVGTTYDLDSSTVKCILERPEMKVVLKANNWGPIDSEIDIEKFPIGISDKKEREDVLRLIEKVGNRVLLFNWYHPNRMKETMSFWEDAGVPTIGLQPAADSTHYKETWPQKELECDIAFVGGYWGYKGQNIGKYLIPFCEPVGEYNVKIFGNSKWSVPQYMGSISESTELALFSSAKICANVSEPHANEFGFEVNERVFKVSACKAFCISDNIASLTEDIFGDAMPTASCFSEYKELVDYYLKHPDERRQKAEKCYNIVMGSHTYHHRMDSLINKLEQL